MPRKCQRKVCGSAQTMDHTCDSLLPSLARKYAAARLRMT